MKSCLLILIILLFSWRVLAEGKNEVITFSYWNEASPPFVFSSDRKQEAIKSGLIKELAELIAQQLDATPKFVKLPVQRIEPHLLSGQVDIDCITNPIWKEHPDAYDWSPSMFESADRLLVRRDDAQKISSFEDLKGNILGVYNGYVYHSDIMKMIENGDIEAVKVADIDHGVQLLLLDRIDVLIDFDVLLSYKLQDVHKNSLAFADLVPETYKLHCAYSKKMRFDENDVNKIISDLVSKGDIRRLLNSY